MCVATSCPCASRSSTTGRPCRARRPPKRRPRQQPARRWAGAGLAPLGLFVAWFRICRGGLHAHLGCLEAPARLLPAPASFQRDQQTAKEADDEEAAVGGRKDKRKPPAGRGKKRNSLTVQVGDSDRRPNTAPGLVTAGAGRPGPLAAAPAPKGGCKAALQSIVADSGRSA